MNSTDISNTIIIIIIFAIINIVSVLGIGIQHIKNNWNRYKCMPVIIPIAGVFGKDPTETFDSCAKGVLNNFMGDILDPVYGAFSEISAITGQVGTFMTSFSGIAGDFKVGFLGSLTDMYDVGTKLLLGLTHFAITLQDIINKVLGIFLTVVYVFLGANYTVISIWNGLPGQLVREATKVAGSI
tara:strand:+ start:1860 stop:2411 length:552 start_codon:yes stop_codon:yes gene_type:complete